MDVDHLRRLGFLIAWKELRRRFDSEEFYWEEGPKELRLEDVGELEQADEDYGSALGNYTYVVTRLCIFGREPKRSFDEQVESNQVGFYR